MFSIVGSICVGDKTSCGGIVATGSTSACVNGRAIARVGDRIACKKNCVITTGKETHVVHGAALALHGSLTSGNCTCLSGNNDFHGHTMDTLAASRVPAAADAGIAFMPDTAALLSEDHWIEFRLTDTGGNPVPGQRFSVLDPAGTERSGYLDDAGYARVSPVKAGQCKITFPDLGQSISVDSCQP
jgi:uncharacterized Zn-binding protein involved in type VI secretion